jgi:hypothetical protein
MKKKKKKEKKGWRLAVVPVIDYWLVVLCTKCDATPHCRGHENGDIRQPNLVTTTALSQLIL